MKLKIILALAAIEATLAWQTGAQSNTAPPTMRIVTNYVTADSSFRVVNGQLYNTEKSVLWKIVSGKCVRVRADGVVLQEIKYNRIYENVYRNNPRELAGSYGSGPDRRLVSSEAIPGKSFFIRNYPKSLSPTTGGVITARAIQIGTTNIGSETLELWDYGTPHVAVVVTTNAPRALRPKNP